MSSPPPPSGSSGSGFPRGMADDGFARPLPRAAPTAPGGMMPPPPRPQPKAQAQLKEAPVASVTHQQAEPKPEPSPQHDPTPSAPAAHTGSAPAAHSAPAVSGDDVPPLNYASPTWSAKPKHPYYFEVLKNGQIVEKIDLGQKERYVVGRIDVCDIVPQHASVSRYHAIVQHSEDGVFIYDLGSTHKTFVNKSAVPVRRYIRLSIGDLVRFAESTRLYVFMAEDTALIEEDEARRTQALIARQKEAAAKEEAKRKAESDGGISWGMGEDAVEEEDEEDGSDAAIIAQFAGSNGLGDVDTSDLYFNKDPKKYLKEWFERRGAGAPEYETSADGPSHAKEYIARVCIYNVGEAPGMSEALYAVGPSAKRQKDSVTNCALKACQMLHQRGELSGTSGSEVRAAREKKQGEEDDDAFFDRTGDIERKKEARLKRSGGDVTVETFKSLTKKQGDLQHELADLEAQILACSEAISGTTSSAESIDDVVKSLEVQDKRQEVIRLRFKQQRTQKQLRDVEELIEIARPAVAAILPLDLTFQAAPQAIAKERQQPAAPAQTVRQEQESSSSPKQPVATIANRASISTPNSSTNTPEPSEQETEFLVPARRIFSVAGPLPSAPAADPVADDSEEVVATDERAERASGAKRTHAQSERVGEQERGEPTNNAAHDIDESSEDKKKKRRRNRGKADGKSSRPGAAVYDEEDSWVPPSNQAGDGSTNLNKRLGY